MNGPEPLANLLDDEFEAATRVLPRAAGASIAPIAGPPRKSGDAPLWVASLGTAAVVLVAALGVGAYVVREKLATRATAESAEPIPTETATETATSAPPSAPAGSIEPLALPSPTEVTRARPVEAVRRTGMVQTFAIGRGQPIWVDGKRAGVGGGHVKIACGRRSIAVGDGRARTYQVPCDGAVVTVGTPDGT